MATLRLYLTSLEPDMEQTICSQSLGGYCSNSLLYPETTLTSDIGLYSDYFNLSIPDSGVWSEWQDLEYVSIGNEVMRVSPIVDGNIQVVQRGFNGIKNMHLAGDRVSAVSSRNIFNDVFNEDRTQYRCLALKNDSLLFDPSTTMYAYDFEVYIKQNSANLNSSIQIALEIPKSQYLSGRSTSWNTMQLIDSSLIGVYPDNHFSESYLRILSGQAIGQGKIVRSFDSLTGTFTFYSSFSSLYDYSGEVEYEIEPSPAQRIKTGIVSPVLNSTYVSSLYEPSEKIPISFSTSGSDIVISDLSPNDIVYLWLERKIEKGTRSYDNNSIVINVKHKVR